MQHNMEFADFRLIKVDFHLNQDFKGDSKAELLTPELFLNSQVEKDKKEMVVVLGVRKIDGNVPYYFEVRAGALFKFKEVPQEPILKQLATINCPSIIYPYLRETIADLTRRAGFPPLHLAPVNFVEWAKTAFEKKGKEPQKAIKQKKKK
jgi:preprotein translocase subunit SecB